MLIFGKLRQVLPRFLGGTSPAAATAAPSAATAKPVARTISSLKPDEIGDFDKATVSAQEAFKALNEPANFSLFHGCYALAEPVNAAAERISAILKRAAQGSPATEGMSLQVLCNLVEEQGGQYFEKQGQQGCIALTIMPVAPAA